MMKRRIEIARWGQSDEKPDSILRLPGEDKFKDKEEVNTPAHSASSTSEYRLHELPHGHYFSIRKEEERRRVRPGARLLRSFLQPPEEDSVKELEEVSLTCARAPGTDPANGPVRTQMEAQK